MRRADGRGAGDPDDDGRGRQLGLRVLTCRKFVMQSIIEKAADKRSGGSDGVPAGTRGSCGGLSSHGGGGGDDRHDDGGFREVGEGGGAVWGARGATGHQSDLLRYSQQPRRARCSSTWRPAQSPRGKSAWPVARGKEIPEGWVLDKDGNATTDPHDFSDGGAILPLGGTEGHKGYGLSAIVEIFSGLLTGLGFGVDPTGRHNDGCFLAAFKVEAFRSLDVFKQEVTDFAHYLKSTPPAKGFDEVYYPGEIEHLRTQSGLEHGIEVEESTWEKLQDFGEPVSGWVIWSS